MSGMRFWWPFFALGGVSLIAWYGTGSRFYLIVGIIFGGLGYVGWAGRPGKHRDG
jgi:hypothetical protein